LTVGSLCSNDKEAIMSTSTTVCRAVPLTAIDEAESTPGVGVTARKTIRATDPYLQGHYPDFTVYPGVFVIESVQQAVSRYVVDTRSNRWEATTTGIDSVRFIKPLLPGDTLHLVVDCVEDGDCISAKARCTDGAGALVTKMNVRFRLSEEPRHA
jgi:3-hydroxyacyl-[acyl-carrier-protein] dehydratase